MDIPVLIEPLNGGRFRATVFHLSAEGATIEEARHRVRDELNAVLNAGGRVATIRVPVPAWDPEFPIPSAAGILKDNPLFDEWQKAIAENRRQADADPSA
jgi:hypothetical protein